MPKRPATMDDMRPILSLEEASTWMLWPQQFRDWVCCNAGLVLGLAAFIEDTKLQGCVFVFFGLVFACKGCIMLSGQNLNRHRKFSGKDPETIEDDEAGRDMHPSASVAENHENEIQHVRWQGNFRAGTLKFLRDPDSWADTAGTGVLVAGNIGRDEINRLLDTIDGDAESGETNRRLDEITGDSEPGETSSLVSKTDLAFKMLCQHKADDVERIDGLLELLGNHETAILDKGKAKNLVIFDEYRDRNNDSIIGILDQMRSCLHALGSIAHKKSSGFDKSAIRKLASVLTRMGLGSALIEILKLPLVEGASPNLRASTNNDVAIATDTDTNMPIDGSLISKVPIGNGILFYFIPVVFVIAIAYLFVKQAFGGKYDSVNLGLKLCGSEISLSARGRAPAETDEEDERKPETEITEESGKDD